MRANRTKELWTRHQTLRCASVGTHSHLTLTTTHNSLCSLSITSQQLETCAGILEAVSLMVHGATLQMTMWNGATVQCLYVVSKKVFFHSLNTSRSTHIKLFSIHLQNASNFIFRNQHYNLKHEYTIRCRQWSGANSFCCDRASSYDSTS